jgi:hypothetical protein
MQLSRTALRQIDSTPRSRPAPFPTHDVHYRNSLCQQIVGNDAAVAAPPHGFSATRRGRCHLRARAPSIRWLGRLVRCRIHDRSVGQRLRARCQLRGGDLIAPHAHDGAAIVAGRSQLIQSGSESVRCRVIGIVPEGGDLPQCIERWRRALFSMPQTAKSRQMPRRSGHRQ